MRRDGGEDDGDGGWAAAAQLGISGRWPVSGPADPLPNLFVAMTASSRAHCSDCSSSHRRPGSCCSCASSQLITLDHDSRLIGLGSAAAHRPRQSSRPIISRHHSYACGLGEENQQPATRVHIGPSATVEWTREARAELAELRTGAHHVMGIVITRHSSGLSDC